MLYERNELEELERYIKLKSDPDLLKWWARFCESTGNIAARARRRRCRGDLLSCYANRAGDTAPQSCRGHGSGVSGVSGSGGLLLAGAGTLLPGRVRRGERNCPRVRQRRRVVPSRPPVRAAGMALGNIPSYGQPKLQPPTRNGPLLFRRLTTGIFRNELRVERATGRGGNDYRFSMILVLERTRSRSNSRSSVTCPLLRNMPAPP
eukprot:974483-Prorocentrum_minimum.AAC.1